MKVLDLSNFDVGDRFRLLHTGLDLCEEAVNEGNWVTGFFS